MADVDEDLAFALFLQEQFDKEHTPGLLEVDKSSGNHVSNSTKPTSIVDPSWELIDPIPDIRQLFLQFNDEYFDGLLAGVEVRWSPRMTLCAGLCCYEGRGGLCSIRLSQPLLKLRPRKDLVETLLHEMIHALLFVTENNKDHDGHGPEFLKHMHRINKQTGTNISVYHNFHDEVDSYRQHWWKCDGPCQKRPPYFGVLRRAMNRAPSPRDPWWGDHQRLCGGTYHKIKEPENYGKRDSKSKSVDTKGENKEKRFKKGKNISTLDKFLDKRKRESDSSADYDSVSENETESKRVKLADESNNLNDIVPFSGSGHQLGSCSTSQNKEKKNTGPQMGGEQLLQKPTMGGEAQLKNDSGEMGSEGQETTDSCMRTVREKWLAKWEKENVLPSGAKSKPKDKVVNSSKSTASDSSFTLHSETDLNHNGNETAKHDTDTLSQNDLSTVNKTISPKSSPHCMTIEEAFKNVHKEKKAPNVENSLPFSPALGSVNRPIELEDSPFIISPLGVGSTHIDLSQESPLKMDLSGESPSSVVKSVVSCPVCRVLILESQINGHLDQCLQ